ncbi:HAD hydrolase-like protein [Patescibacteria group bacterium]|nr:HAD hydrolase-like protein [Patescibacteria group bacterium]
MKKVTTVVFDFDGVIADTLPFTFRKIIEISRKIDPDNLDEKKIIEEIRSKDWKELLSAGGMPMFWLKLPFVLAIIARMQVHLGEEIETIKVFPGMRKLLSDLRKKRLRTVILSSNLRSNVDRFIKLNRLDSFDYIDAGTFTMLSKSGRLERIMKTFALSKNQVIHVGDEIRDLEASKKVGIKSIGVAWGLHTVKTLKDHGAEFIARKPSDIIKIISQ